ncbi:MAG: fatty acid desaturase [Terrimicrobiaceae bacterium]|nr:fatty acid desaturase [Terrimicrobiaceae bacterium]
MTIEAPDSNRREHVDATAFVGGALTLLVLQAASVIAIGRGWWWLLGMLIPITAHFMHGALIGLHEASHGLLRKNRWLNEADGILIGVFSFTSFSLYRAAHQTHHAHLGRERDEEFWPFVCTDVPRWARVAAAVGELTFGMIFSPWIFFRSFLRKGSPIRSPKVRRRIWQEIGAMVLVWVLVLSAVQIWSLWPYFIGAYLIPAWLAGNLQSWRKYIEHIGMNGDTVNGLTRSIVPQTAFGRLIAFTLLHEPFHGVHHQKSALPHAVLPQHVDLLEPSRSDEVAPFPSYRAALGHLFRSLGDPTMGPQWRAR